MAAAAAPCPDHACARSPGRGRTSAAVHASACPRGGEQHLAGPPGAGGRRERGGVAGAALLHVRDEGVDGRHPCADVRTGRPGPANRVRSRPRRNVHGTRPAPADGEQGHELLDAALRRAERIRRAAQLPGLAPMGQEVVDAGLAAAFDPLEIVIDVRGLGISGRQAAEWLRATWTSVAPTPVASAPPSPMPTTRRRRSSRTPCTPWSTRRTPWSGARPCGCPPRRPWNRSRPCCRARRSRARRACARRARRGPYRRRAGQPYPPGVPVVAPGEVLTDEVLDYLRSGVEHGVLISDVADPRCGRCVWCRT